MTNGEKKPPFYERRAFQGTAAVVALTAALLALVGPLKGIVNDLFPDTEPVSWVQVVLDTSVAMEEEFDGETRLEAAADAIGKSVKELENEGLGLRRTAPTCDGRSEQVVDLDSGHADDVIEEAKNQRPRGKSSIVDAVIGALQEFKREPIARGGPESRRLLVFTAGASLCEEEDLGDEMSEELSAAGISKASKIELIAMDGPGAAEEAEMETPGGNGALQALSAPLEEHGLSVEVHEPQDVRELREVASSIGAQASRANEILEEERENGFYEQE